MIDRLHVLQHVPFESPGHVGWWALQNGVQLVRVQLYAGKQLPSIKDVEALVIMGGPMSVGDEAEHPFLAEEKELIEQALEDEVPMLGICLGAQLIADVLGAEIGPAEAREVGWIPVEATEAAGEHRIGQALPARFEALHWHAETFELPEGATHMARTPACEHQAFAYGDHIVGLQFHLEMDPRDVEDLADACPEDLAPGDYVQTREEMLAAEAGFEAAHEVLEDLLAAWLRS